MPTPRKPKRAVEKCIFCKAEAEITAEHLLSKRFHRLIPQTATGFKVLRSVEYINHSTFAPGKFNGDPRHWKIKSVCEKNCNNGWMRTLEERIDNLLAALFTGDELRLTEDDLTSLATWAAMKAVVLDSIDPKDATTHHMQRYALYRNQRPPSSGWAVWIGHHPRKEQDMVYRSAPFLVAPKNMPAERPPYLATHFNASIISYVVGELFVQVVHAPKPFGIEKWTYPRLPNGGSLRRIWPLPSFQVAWPPAPMNDHDVGVAFNLFRGRIVRGIRERAAKSKLGDVHGRGLF